MGRSQRLGLSDLRGVFRLLGEIRELGAEPLVWRRHMLESLVQMVESRAGLSGEVSYAGEAPVPAPESFVDVGTPGVVDWRMLSSFVSSPEAQRCPVYSAIMRWSARGCTENYSGGRIPSDFDARAYEESTLRDRYRAAGLNGYIHSLEPLPLGRTSHVIALVRGSADDPFTRVQTRLVRLFHTELARLWRVPPSDDMPVLTPRLRQTLDGLLAGLSEKEIARQFGISQHTVHNYLKELHRRFGVASRGELLARCGAARRPNFFPRLSTLPLALPPGPSAEDGTTEGP